MDYEFHLNMSSCGAFIIRGVARIGELVNFEACMDIMDLLYEKEETSVLFSSPCSLAASTLACFFYRTLLCFGNTITQFALLVFVSNT